MVKEQTRVDFNAPTSLVERVDAVAEVLDTSRTRILIDALRDELDDLAQDQELRRSISNAFYANQLDYETVESILGTEEALRMQLLQDSIDRDPPEPVMTEPPSAEEFYDGSVADWTPDNDAESTR